MGVDVYTRWRGKDDDAEGTRGYCRNGAACEVFFGEVCEQSWLRLKAENVYKADDPRGIRIVERGMAEDIDFEKMSDAEYEAYEEDGRWRAYPAGLLESRREEARAHTLAACEAEIRAEPRKGPLDELFKHRWEQYEDLLKTMREEEEKHGEPVEVSVSY